MKQPADLKVIQSQRVGGVTVEKIYARDRYDGWRYIISRTLTRASLMLMRVYLAHHPHYAFEDRRNLARRMAYMLPGIRAWSAYMPGGFATHYVFSPSETRLVNGKYLDIISRWLFRYSLDGRGVRSRMRIVEKWASERISSMDHVRWLSVAAGSGLATYETLSRIKPTLTTIDLTLADIDKSMLRFARKVRKRYPASLAKTVVAVADVTKSNDINKLVTKTRPDIIECVGICEYLDDEALVTFISRLYNMMPTGSLIIFSNMSPTHPELDIHHRTTGWPGVYVRSNARVIELVCQAGVAPDELRAAMVSDGVYGMYRVEKRRA